LKREAKETNESILLVDRNDNEILGEQIDVLGPAFDL